LAAAIKDARNKSNFSRGQLATRISVKETVLADYEMAKSEYILFLAFSLYLSLSLSLSSFSHLSFPSARITLLISTSPYAAIPNMAIIRKLEKALHTQLAHLVAKPTTGARRRVEGN